MTKAQKKDFVRVLIKNCKKDILENVARMPEEWDGHELRQYIADFFARQSTLSTRLHGERAWERRCYRDYKNEVLVRNL